MGFICKSNAIREVILKAISSFGVRLQSKGEKRYKRKLLHFLSWCNGAMQHESLQSGGHYILRALCNPGVVRTYFNNRLVNSSSILQQIS